MPSEFLFFGLFLVGIIFLLLLDLGLLNKSDQVVSFKKASIMSICWVSLALLFYLFIDQFGHLIHGIYEYSYLEQIVAKHRHLIRLNPIDFNESLAVYNHNLALEFITGYLVEYALSADNVFVMVLIFAAFKVEERYYHRVLFWGILGAIVMRFLFIFIGSTLISHFGWILYVFGAFLMYTGLALFFKKDEEEHIDSENHWVVKWAAKWFAVHPAFVGNQFFTRIDGKRMVTSLFVVLMVVEFTDLIFAVDSIPAIFAVTKDPYIVFFSNIFAILGLRSMFFLLINVIHKVRFLKYGLAIILTFIGAKMLLEHWLHDWGFSNVHSLLVVAFVLIGSTALSFLIKKKKA